MLGVMCTSHNWVSLRLDGSCSVKQRQALVDTFNDPTVRRRVVPLCSASTVPCGFDSAVKQTSKQADNRHDDAVMLMHMLVSVFSLALGGLQPVCLCSTLALCCSCPPRLAVWDSTSLAQTAWCCLTQVGMAACSLTCCAAPRK